MAIINGVEVPDAHLTETAIYEPSVREVMTGELVAGGADAPVNIQGKHLANRTAYLKQKVDTLETKVSVLEAEEPVSTDDCLKKAQNLADIPNKVLARQNLGVAEISHSHAVYLEKTQNLSDIPDKAAARQNLGVTAVNPGDMGRIVGMVFAYAGIAAPAHSLFCDGASLSRTTYSALFDVIGVTYGNENSTTFKLPDLRGEFIRGLSNGRTGADEDRTLGSFQDSCNKSHSHTLSSLGTSENGNHEHAFPVFKTTAQSNSGNCLFGADNPSDPSNGNPYYTMDTGVMSQSGSHYHSITGILGSDGNIESRPRNVALNYCIIVE